LRPARRRARSLETLEYALMYMTVATSSLLVGPVRAAHKRPGLGQAGCLSLQQCSAKKNRGSGSQREAATQRECRPATTPKKRCGLSPQHQKTYLTRKGPASRAYG
jgi:hypothetical protein